MATDDTFMANLTGSVVLAKRLRKHPVWRRDPASYGHAWADLLMLAVDGSGGPQTFYVRGNPVTLERGQVGWSIVRLAEEWKRSREWVQAFLRFCQDQAMLTVTTSPLGTVITILNYDAYQVPPGEGIGEGTGDGEVLEDSTTEPATEPPSDSTSDSTTEPATEPSADSTHNRVMGKGNRVNGKGVSGLRPQARPPEGGPSLIPTDAEVAEFCAGYQDLARGIDGIPEGWWSGWLANKLGDHRRPFPANWKRVLALAFTSDFQNRHVKAVPSGPGSAFQKKSAALSGGQHGGMSVAQARFKLDRELEQVRERLDACYDTNTEPSAGDVAREKELERQLREMETGVQASGGAR